MPKFNLNFEFEIIKLLQTIKKIKLNLGCHITSFLPSSNNTTNNSSIETRLPPSPQLFGASEKEENLNKKENLNNSSLSSSPAILRRVQSHTCIVSPLQAAHRSPVYNNCQYNSAAIQPLHGVS